MPYSSVSVSSQGSLRTPLLVGFVLMLFNGFAAMESEAQETSPSPQWNIVLISVDDMNRDSVGTYGCTLEGITPSIDQLASEGICFDRAHVTIAVCQPCRAVWMTGLYPHRNGAVGFNNIKQGIPTVPETLREAGYLTAILGKTHHVLPSRKDAWEVSVTRPELGQGRSPSAYYRESLAAFKKAAESQRPLFLMANSHDPHRPFSGSQQERRQIEKWRSVSADPIEVSRTYAASEVDVPKFLPEAGPIRREIAQYYTSVHRADETVGAVLKAIEDSGARESTVVLFMSDNGMPLPFAKTNCYFHSTQTPLIVRWPGEVEAGARDKQHFVSGIDIAPTILEWAGVPQWETCDGSSIVPVLKGEQQPNRDHVYTQFHRTSGRNDYPMRALTTEQGSYIYNAWSDGEMRFKNESQSGLTMKAMIAAGKEDAQVQERVQLFLYRVPNEYYEAESDVDSLHNQVGNEAFREIVATHRERLEQIMSKYEDPLLPRYQDFLKSQAN